MMVSTTRQSVLGACSDLYSPQAQSQIDSATMAAMQQQMAQQAAFSQIPDVVKRVRALSPVHACTIAELDPSLLSTSIKP